MNKCVLVVFALSISLNLSGQNTKYFTKVDKYAKLYLASTCPEKIRSGGEKMRLQLEYLKSLGDTMVFKFYEEDLFGTMDDDVKRVLGSVYTFMKVINDEVYIENDPMVYKQLPMLPRRFQLCAFNVSPGTKWKAKGFSLFFHNEITVTYLSKHVERVLNDTIYNFAISGDRATSHTVYLTGFSISKLYGITKLAYEPIDGCRIAYYSPALGNKRRLKALINEGR